MHVGEFGPEAKWRHVRYSVTLGGKADGICSMSLFALLTNAGIAMGKDGLTFVTCAVAI